jgi:hypothetical protein
MKPKVLKAACRGLLRRYRGSIPWSVEGHSLQKRNKELLKYIKNIFIYLKIKQEVLEKINGVLSCHTIETAYKISKEGTQSKKMSLFDCEAGQQEKVLCCAI